MHYLSFSVQLEVLYPTVYRQHRSRSGSIPISSEFVTFLMFVHFQMFVPSLLFCFVFGSLGGVHLIMPGLLWKAMHIHMCPLRDIVKDPLVCFMSNILGFFFLLPMFCNKLNNNSLQLPSFWLRNQKRLIMMHPMI